MVPSELAPLAAHDEIYARSRNKPRGHAIAGMVTALATDAAKLWDGYPLIDTNLSPFLAHPRGGLLFWRWQMLAGACYYTARGPLSTVCNWKPA